MSLTLPEVRRIARDVAQQQSPAVDVVGVTGREGSSGSAEVIFAVRDPEREPSRLVIGVSRQTSASECQGTVRSRLRAMLATVTDKAKA
jgi:hypothetical protein